MLIPKKLTRLVGIQKILGKILYILIKNIRIITSGGDNIINLYCTAQGQLLLKIKRHRSPVLTAVFNPVSGNIYSGGVDNWIGIWNDKGDFVIFSKYFITSQVDEI